MKFQHWTISGHYFRLVALGMVVILSWIFIENIVDIRIRLRDLLPKVPEIPNDPVIIYEKCTKIPKAPKGTLWPEEKYIHDIEIEDIRELADPLLSKVWVDGSNVAKIGDSVRVMVLLFDGYGVRKKSGGDLVRVWMKEPSLGASSAAEVRDNKDGSYSAIFTAFWEGQPEITAAIISPREVIATALKRRYICPPVLMNTAIFVHPLEPSITEETPCSYDNQVPGYKQLCNFTQENYGRPWYCGKPSHSRLQCQDWSMTADINLWYKGSERQALPNKSYELMDMKYTAMKISSNLTLTVIRGSSNQSVYDPPEKCGQVSNSATWELSSPTGFFYRRNWTFKNCRKTFDPAKLLSCLKDTSVILTGDSTTRQIFYQIEQLVPCKWVTDTWSISGKHRPAMCINTALNFSLTWKPHSLPFCTRNSPWHYFKSFNAILNDIQDQSKTIVLLHMYAHIVNYHSHAFYETLKDMKRGIISLLGRNSNAKIVIKGPHAYSFSKSSDHAIWMPDAYAEVYQDFIYNEFKDINDRVVYLECMDMTVSTEQWHIHAERYVMNAIVGNMFDRVCR